MTALLVADAAPVDDDPGLRGSLQLRRRAVERIVAAAAGEVAATGGSVSRLLGQSLRPADADARPRAAVEVSGDLVTAELSLSLPWGTPVTEVVDEVRRNVALRLRDLAQLRVGHVDVVVTALPVRRARRRLA